MKKQIQLCLCIMLLTSVAFGQSCGNHATIYDSKFTIHYGNSQLLSDIYQLIKKHRIQRSSKEGRGTTVSHLDNDEDILFDIPLKVWIYNREPPEKPSPLASNLEIENIIADLNEIFKPVGIRLHLKCEIEQVFDDNFWRIKNQTHDKQMKETYHDESAFNMHVPGESPMGWGELPWFALNASFSIGGKNINHVAHELGHALGLYHTFDSIRGDGTNGNQKDKCLQESVSRERLQSADCDESTRGKKKCEVNGDGFCDTKADYEKSSDNFNLECGYSGTKQDNWGDLFTPPTDNIMSYWYSPFWFKPECPFRFTPDQYAAMVLYFYQYFQPLISFNSISIVGEIFDDESKKFAAQGEIINNGALVVHDGGELRLHAREKITLNNGFYAGPNSKLDLQVKPITDCEITNIYSAKNLVFSKKVKENQNGFIKELSLLIQKHLNQTQSDEVSTKPEFNNLNERIDIYPTFLEDDEEIHISYNLLTNEYINEVSLYSMNGNKLSSLKNGNKISKGKINYRVDFLTSVGFYIIEIITNKGTRASKVLIK